MKKSQRKKPKFYKGQVVRNQSGRGSEDGFCSYNSELENGALGLFKLCMDL